MVMCALYPQILDWAQRQRYMGLWRVRKEARTLPHASEPRERRLREVHAVLDPPEGSRRMRHNTRHTRARERFEFASEGRVRIWASLFCKGERCLQAWRVITANSQVRAAHEQARSKLPSTEGPQRGADDACRSRNYRVRELSG